MGPDIQKGLDKLWLNDKWNNWLQIRCRTWALVSEASTGLTKAGGGLSDFKLTADSEAGEGSGGP